MQLFTVFVVIGVVVVSATESDVQQLPVSKTENLMIDNSNTLATYGYTVNRGQFPHYAKLHIQNDVYVNSMIVAGGSLITPNYILTRANELSLHINYYNSTYGYVILGLDDGSDKARQQRINFIESGIHIHPLYTGYRNDIATVRLDHPATFNQFVQPIRLPSLSDVRTYEGMEGTTVGTQISVERYVRNQILTNDKCIQLHTYNIQEQHMCTNTYVGGAFCSRDYGAGLLVEDGKGPMLVGVTTIYKMCNENYPAIYVRVSSFRDWIAENSDYVFDL